MRPASAPPRRCPAVILAAATAAWCCLLLAPPLLHLAGNDAAAALTRALFHPICHQIPERSFLIGGAPLAVCARCTGLYAGFLAGCSILALFMNFARSRSALPPDRRVLLLACLPALFEAAAELAGLAPGTGAGRAVTGAVFGFAAAFYVLPAVEEMGGEILREIKRPERPREEAHAAAG